MDHRYRSPSPASGRRVLDVDRHADGLVVTFDDGRVAVFDADWIYGQIQHARLTLEPGDEEPRRYGSEPPRT